MYLKASKYWNLITNIFELIDLIYVPIEELRRQCIVIWNESRFCRAVIVSRLASWQRAFHPSHSSLNQWTRSPCLNIWMEFMICLFLDANQQRNLLLIRNFIFNYLNNSRKLIFRLWNNKIKQIYFK